MRNVHFALRLGYDGQPFCGWQAGATPVSCTGDLGRRALFEGTRGCSAPRAQTPGFTLVTNVLCSPGMRASMRSAS